MEESLRVGPLRVIKKRGINRTGGVVKSEENDAPPRSHRRSLSGHLDPGNQYLLPRTSTEEINSPYHAQTTMFGTRLRSERVQQRQMWVENMATDIKSEHGEFGLNTFVSSEFR